MFFLLFVSLARGLLILLIFLKNHFLFHSPLFFCYYFINFSSFFYYFPFLPCSRLLAPSLLQAPGSFPVSASEEGRQHHGPPRGRHPPDLLLLQRSHRHHCPGHLPCGECAGGPGHCVCVCACEGGPDLWRPLEWEDRCSPPPLGTLDKSLPCSGPWAPSLSKAGEGTLQQWQEWEEGSLF